MQNSRFMRLTGVFIFTLLAVSLTTPAAKADPIASFFAEANKTMRTGRKGEFARGLEATAKVGEDYREFVGRNGGDAFASLLAEERAFGQSDEAGVIREPVAPKNEYRPGAFVRLLNWAFSENESGE